MAPHGQGAILTPAEETADLERKLAASRDRPGYGDRVTAIEARLAVLRALAFYDEQVARSNGG